MSHRMNDMPSRPVGRPREGAEKRSVFVRFRIEPYIDQQMKNACKRLGITKSEGFRQGLMLFLKEAEKIFYGR